MNDNRRGATVTIDGRSAAIAVFVLCLIVEIGLVLLDYFVNYGRLSQSAAVRRFANIAREDGIASWFASTQTLLVGLTAWIFWLGARADSSAAWRRRGWLLVAVLFTYMAVDDAAQLHERMGAALRSAWPVSFPTFMWHLAFAPIFAIAGILAAVFLWREFGGGWSAWLLVAGFALFGFAVGLDFIEGLEPDHPWNVYAIFLRSGADGASIDSRQYETFLHFSRSVEEVAEMLGTTCIWTSLLSHLGAMPDIRFQS
ncbi:MAG: hypothetical protein AB7F99_15115 [Vicinamibacterales bacterium]